MIRKLAWPARETMPQIAFDVREAQQKMAEPVVQRLLEANALLRKAKKIEKESGSIRIPKVDLNKAVMVAFSDASFGNMPRHGSQAGFLILVAEQSCVHTTSKATVVFLGFAQDYASGEEHVGGRGRCIERSAGPV